MMLGPVSAVDMAARLRVNRTTIVRGLADMGDEVVSMGATRRTRYALRRVHPECGESLADLCHG